MIIVGLSLLVLIYLIPFIWVIMTSVKPTSLIMSSPPIFAFKPTINHYQRLYTEWHFFGKVVNSLIVSSGTTALSIIIGMFAAFSLSRFMFRGRNFLPVWILSFRFLPIVAILLPLFLMFRYLELIDTYVALILANLIPALPFSIWLLQGFLDEIPLELDEAAKIDGCGYLTILWRIIFPLAKPGVAVTAIFTFLFSWNDFFIPLALTRTKTNTVTVAFGGFKQQFRFDWGAMCAAAVICLVPLLIIVMLTQKHIIRGMTLGAVKE